MTRIEKDDLGFDQFFSDNVQSVHVERMRDEHFWLKVLTKDGGEYIIWLSAESPIRGRFEAY